MHMPVKYEDKDLQRIAATWELGDKHKIVTFIFFKLQYMNQKCYLMKCSMCRRSTPVSSSKGYGQSKATNKSHLREVSVRFTKRARLRALDPLLLMAFSAKLSG